MASTILPEGSYDLSKSIKRAEPNSPRDSVIFDASAEGLANSGFAEISKSDALRQPLASLESKIKGRLDIGSLEEPVSQNIEQFLDYVAAHRLKHMPHKGSRWDKILQQFVSLSSQVHRYEAAVAEILLEASQASSLVYACLQTLLELSPTYSATLEPVGVALYRVSTLLNLVLRHVATVASTESIQQTLANVLVDVSMVVVDLTHHYTTDTRSLTSNEFQIQFGSTIASIESQKNLLMDEIWSIMLEQIQVSQEMTYSIDRIRRFLSPFDSTVAILTNSLAIQTRTEFTCEWFDNYLMSFIRGKDRNLLVTGKSGCGKSVLTNWIVERLERLQGVKATDVVVHKIQPDFVSETASASIAKGLLVQLLDFNIGNSRLSKALNAVLDMASMGSPAVDVEDALWRAVSEGFNYNHQVTVVIDGIDHVMGGHRAASKVLERVRSMTSNITTVKLIVLSSPIDDTTLPDVKYVNIEPRLVQPDIKLFVTDLVQHSPHMDSLTEIERTKVIDQISVPADGSFVWAKVTYATIMRQNTVSAILKSLETTARGLDLALEKLVFSLDLQHPDTRSLLAWMLAVKRPLHLTEIKTFLELNPADGTHVTRLSNVEDEVHRILEGLITIQDGYVKFVHISIRNYLLELAGSVTDLSNSGKFPFMLKEAHFDVATRCVAYLRLFLTQTAAPSVSMSPDTISDMFRGNPLLEYCVRYWNVHVEHSPIYQPDGNHKLVPTFKKNFPSSVLLAVLERPTWEAQFPPTKLIHMHDLALTLRVSILGSENAAVLQTKLNLAVMYKKLNERIKASDAFFDAYTLSLKLFGKQHTTTIGCAVGVLESTHPVKITTRNSSSIRLESVLRFIVDAQQMSSEDTIKYSTMLAELYTTLSETDKAISLWRTVYEISAETFGSFDSQTTKSYRILVTALKKLNRYTDLAEVMQFAYDRARKSLSVTDSTRRELAIGLVQLHEDQIDSSAAEEILVDEWQSLTDAAISTGQKDWQSEKLGLAVHYAQFLRKHQRNSEAQNILVGTWSEYKNRTDVRSETVMNMFVTMAQEMKQLQMTETAHSILLSVWNGAKVSTQQTALAQLIATELLQTTEQIVQTKKEIIDSDLSIEENIMEDIAQTTSVLTTSSKTHNRTDTSFTTSDSLSLFYYGQQRWTEAIRVCTKFLERTWPAVLEIPTTSKLVLPVRMHREVILIIMRLAECHFNSGETVDSERLMQSVFTAASRSLTYTDSNLNSVSTTLIKFFESTHQFRKALNVHEVLFDLIKEKAGPSSEPAIHAALQCARYCIKHGLHKDPERFYLHVFVTLGRDTDVLTEDTLEAAQWLEAFYKRENLMKDARPVYPKIWQTIVKRGKQYGVTAEYVDRFYSNYVAAMRTHYEADYEQIRQVSLQFRDISVSLFGSEHELTLKATYDLAVICEDDEKYREEAIQLYKSILSVTEKKKTSTALSSQILKVIRETKKQVSHLYSSSETTTKQAVAMIAEELETSKSQLGYAHRITLEQQHQLLTSLSKENSTESLTRILKILETSVADIMATEKDATRLFESATQIARSYTETSNTETAITVLKQLRRQVVFHEQSKDLKIKLNKTDRSSFAFVAAFEMALYPQRQFSDIMSELMTESIRYESYHKAVREKSSLVTILLRGSQLLQYLERKQHKSEIEHVRVDMMKIFTSYIAVQTQESQLKAFFDIVMSHATQVEEKSTILKVVVQRVLADLNESRFREAHELASLELRFMQLNNELSTLDNIGYGLDLALYLSGRGISKRCGDATLAVEMLKISKTILPLVLIAGHNLKIQFSTMSLDEVNMLAGLLGQLEMFAELEAILIELWTSRHVQQTWTSSTIVTLGRRLVEVHFAAGHRESAIHLCGDIIYNLRRVWGEVDTTTIGFWDLLGELHGVSGNFHAAQNVHEELLRQTLIAVEDGDITAYKGAAIAATRMDLLKIAFQRAGGWSHDIKLYTDLQAQLRAEFGKESAWTQGESSKQGIEKWTKQAPKTDAGLWKRPTRWEFVVVENSGNHRNHLRKISGIFASSPVSGAGPRGNKSYGSELHNGSDNTRAKEVEASQGPEILTMPNTDGEAKKSDTSKRPESKPVSSDNGKTKGGDAMKGSEVREVKGSVEVKEGDASRGPEIRKR